LVELYGRIGVNTYINTQGEPKATLTFHVNNIKLPGKATFKEATAVHENITAEPSDDLPF